LVDRPECSKHSTKYLPGINEKTAMSINYKSSVGGMAQWLMCEFLAPKKGKKEWEEG
jgi:hypothetical protein